MRKYARKCDQCGKVFNEWYCIFEGGLYFCSDKCLNKHFTKNEIKDLDLWGDYSDSYRTEWECEEDYEYYEDWTLIEDSEECEEETDKEIIYRKIADLYDYIQDSDYLEKEYILEELANIQSYANC